MIEHAQIKKVCLTPTIYNGTWPRMIEHRCLSRKEKRQKKVDECKAEYAKIKRKGEVLFVVCLILICLSFIEIFVYKSSLYIPLLWLPILDIGLIIDKESELYKKYENALEKLDR